MLLALTRVPPLIVLTRALTNEGAGVRQEARGGERGSHERMRRVCREVKRSLPLLHTTSATSSRRSLVLPSTGEQHNSQRWSGKGNTGEGRSSLLSSGCVWARTHTHTHNCIHVCKPFLQIMRRKSPLRHCVRVYSMWEESLSLGERTQHALLRRSLVAAQRAAAV